VAKVIIPLSQLPPPNRDGTHVVRFRIATEDKGSISEWSKLFRVESTGQKSNGLVAADLTVLTQGVYGQLPTHPSPPITSIALKQLFGVFDTGLIDL